MVGRADWSACEADWDELEILCGARARKSPGIWKTRRQREIVRRSASLVRAIISRESGVKAGRRSEEKEEVGLIKRKRHGKGKGKRKRQAYRHGRIRFQLPDDHRRQYVSLLLLVAFRCFASLFRSFFVAFLVCTQSL